jgi:hypothetical protein
VALSAGRRHSRGAIAQLVERLHGMQEARGSSPLSSTSFSDLRSKSSDYPSDYGAGLAGVGFEVPEHVHDGRRAPDGGDDHVSVDGLGEVG